MNEPVRLYRINAPLLGGVLGLIVLQLATYAPPGFAAWAPDGVPLAPARSAQTMPRTVPDGAGGVIVVWQDSRLCGSDIYAQRLDSSGSPLWAVDGVVVCSVPDTQAFPQTASDLAGGAIVFFQDRRSGNIDVYAQRIDPAGHLLWGPGGVAMTMALGDQQFDSPYDNFAVSDGASGALVVWSDYRFGTSGTVLYTQHVLASGAIAFGDPNGKPLSTVLALEEFPSICSNGAGGAIVAWVDGRSGVAPDIYAQSIDPAGTLKWSAAGDPVCTEPNGQNQPQVAPDGFGGAIIAWGDGRDPTNSDMYAQHLNSVGVPLWPSGGIPICAAAGEQTGTQITADGFGGAVIAWDDQRSSLLYDVYAQRVSGGGGALWPIADGTPICTAAGSQYVRRLAPDGTGGAIIVWRDDRSAVSGPNLYIQRAFASGALAWAPGTGVLLSSAPLIQDLPDIISDGASGAIVAWQDSRSGPGAGSIGLDIYAGRVNSVGNPLWIPNGTLVAAPGHPEESPDIVPDGSGGAIVAWEDFRHCDLDIYAQGADASGRISWDVDGVPLCTAAGTQQTPKVCSDGSGGAIVVWSDARAGNFDIYAQRVNHSGVPQWGTNGVPVCTDVSPQITPVITACATGGALIAWEDQRGGAHNIYLQRITDTGAIETGWPANGLGVTSATNSTTEFAPQIIPDGACGAIVTWQDRRSGNYDIYVQRVDLLGVRRWLPPGVPVCAAIEDQSSPRLVTDGLGGAIVTWEDSRAGNVDVAARRVDSSGTPLWSVDGVPVCAEIHDQGQPRVATDGASGAIITWRDSRGGGSDVYAQRVNAGGFMLWLAEGVVICDAALAQQDPEITSDGAGGAVIAWRDGRSGNDDIYTQRIDSSGRAFCAGCGVALTSATGAQFQNVIASDGSGGAIVGWADLRSTRAADKEIYAMRLAPGCGTYATGVTPDPAAPFNQLSQNRPNPFNPSTTIFYSLSAKGRVVIRIYDIAGRCVTTLVDEVEGVGPHSVRWEGQADSRRRAVSGAYFYTVQYPDGTSSSKKMMMLR